MILKKTKTKEKKQIKNNNKIKDKRLNNRSYRIINLVPWLHPQPF